MPTTSATVIDDARQLLEDRILGPAAELEILLRHSGEVALADQAARTLFAYRRLLRSIRERTTDNPHPRFRFPDEA